VTLDLSPLNAVHVPGRPPLPQLCSHPLLFRCYLLRMLRRVYELRHHLRPELRASSYLMRLLRVWMACAVLHVIAHRFCRLTFRP
jgi:hypothetical protein